MKSNMISWLLQQSSITISNTASDNYKINQHFITKLINTSASDNSEAGDERDAGGRQPRISGDEVSNRKLGSLRRGKHMISRPVHPAGGGGAGSHIPIFSKIQRFVGGATRPLPLVPSTRRYRAVDVGLHHDGPRVLLPRPPQIRAERALGAREARPHRDLAVVD